MIARRTTLFACWGSVSKLPSFRCEALRLRMLFGDLTGPSSGVRGLTAIGGLILCSAPHSPCNAVLGLGPGPAAPGLGDELQVAVPRFARPAVDAVLGKPDQVDVEGGQER